MSDPKKRRPILLRLSPDLLKKIEKAAVAGQCSRNTEAARRLAESFRKKTEGLTS